MTTMGARRLFVVLLALLAALDALIFAVRLGDVAAFGRLILFPAEGPVLYAIWKIRHGYPLYEWPTRPYFVLTLYNFLFYKTYAAIFAAAGVTSDRFAIAGRAITALFALGGAAAQYLAVRRLTPVPPSFRVPLVLLCLVTWIGVALPGWWALSIRPDVPAAAVSACGLAAAFTAFRGGRSGWLAAAGAAFFAAWALKQSQVALFVATCLYVAVWRRSAAGLALLVLPFAAGAGLSLAIGGAVYRANVLDAARVNALIPYLALYWYRSIALPNLLFWGTAVVVIIALARPGSVHPPLRSPADVPLRSRRVFAADLTYPALASVVAGLAGAVLLAKVGSALNHLLELNLAASLACAVVLASAWESPKARALFAAAALMLVPMIAFDAAIVHDDDGRLAAVLELKGWGPGLHLGSPAEAEERARLEAIFARLPRPVFSDDELFAQPWHATGDRYPAVMLDHVYYDAARARGLVGRGVEGLFADRYFAAAVLPDSSAFLPAAMRAGYRLSATFPRAGAEPLRLLVRDR